MKQLLFLFAVAVYLCFSFSTLQAQIPQAPVNVQSPNAASLGEYGEVPVSPFTGLPNIAVPLCSGNSGSLSIPVALNYHGSGFRPDEHSGWVGLGWSLSSGGVITRSVNDLPDEKVNNDLRTDDAGYYMGMYYPTRRRILYYFTSDDNSRIDWNNKAQTTNLMRDGICWPSSSNPLYKFDTEPDEFSFQLPGCSGKFYMGEDGWKVRCDKPVTVITGPLLPAPYYDKPQTGGSSYNKFGGFTIVTEDGTRYEFGMNTDAIEYSVDYFRQGAEEWTANAWYLTRVSKNGQEINLSYTRYMNRFICQMYFSASAILFNMFHDKDNGDCQGAYQGIGSRPYYFSGQLVAPVYLSTITSTNSTIRFISSVSNEMKYEQSVFDANYSAISTGPGDKLYYLQRPLQNDNNGYSINYPACFYQRVEWRKLDAIQVEDRGGIRKQFTLTYSNSSSERLTLSQVTEKGSNGVAKPPYTFTYLGSTQLWPYLYDGVDHWGYLNSTPSDPYTYLANYKARREPMSSDPDNLSNLSHHIIQTITYPTGGKTEFTYELNQYAKQVQKPGQAPVLLAADKKGGGLRIAKIVSYPINRSQPATQKEYYYVTGQYQNGVNPATMRSSGVLGQDFLYGFDNYILDAARPFIGYAWLSIFSSQSALPACQNSAGSTIGYTQIVEKRSDGSYTMFKYSNLDTANPDEAPGNCLDEAPVDFLAGRINASSINPDPATPYVPVSSTAQGRGQLLQEVAFTSTNLPVKSHEITYTNFRRFNGEEQYVRSVRAQARDLHGSCNGAWAAEGTAYKFYVYSSLPATETERIYNADGIAFLANTKSYSYNTRKLLAEARTADSKGQPVVTKYKYTCDFADEYYTNSSNPSVPPTPIAQAFVEMARDKASNMVAYPMETLQYRAGKLVGVTLNTYLRSGNNFLPYQTSALEVARPLEEVQYTKAYSANGVFTVDAKLQLKAFYTTYDKVGNVLGIQKEGNNLTSYLWGYNSTLPIAQVANAAPNEIFHSNLEEDKMVATATADVAGTWYSPGGYLRFEATTSDPNRPSMRKVAHTGQLAGAMYTGYQGEQAHAFSSTLTLPARTSSRRYILSGWVYTNGPAASIWLFPNLPGARNADGTVNYYDGFGNSSRPDLFPSYASTQVDVKPDQIGQWVYLQKEVEVPGDATLLTMRITNYWNGAGNAAATANGGSVWFDDVRLYPADAQMVTYTHDPLAGQTSISDPNSRPIYYEYDDLQRLQLVKDMNRNIVKHVEYHYQR
jgi:hypothetical protein